MVQFRIRFGPPWYWRFYHSGYGMGEGYRWTKREAKMALLDCMIDLGYFE